MRRDQKAQITFSRWELTEKRSEFEDYAALRRALFRYLIVGDWCVIQITVKGYVLNNGVLQTQTDAKED